MKKLISLVLALAIIILLSQQVLAEDTTEHTYLAYSNTCLAFRDENGIRITNMPEKEPFIVLNTDPNDSERVWVSWNGIEGSIIEREITNLNNSCLANVILNSSQPLAFTKRGLNLRNTNTYEIIQELPAGSFVTIVGNDPFNLDRLIVNYYGTEGTILKDGLFFTSHANFILVDISTQTISMFKNGEILIISKVVTGLKDSRDTPKGFFSINSMTRDTHLVGEDYDVPVQYWMPFFKKCGLHDASWRNSFGGNIYVNHGSHGCVNMCLDAVKFIYENAYVGIPVIVY